MKTMKVLVMYTVFFSVVHQFLIATWKRLLMSILPMSDMKHAAEKHGAHATDMQSCLLPCTFHQPGGC